MEPAFAGIRGATLAITQSAGSVPISNRAASIAEPHSVPSTTASDPALDDLAPIEQLHEDSVVGKFDAAVVDQESGKPHIVKRMDRPRVRVVPERL